MLQLLERASLKQAAIALPIVLFAYIILGSIYRLYFHPLAKFPGPKLFALTNLVQLRHVVRGEWMKQVLALHEQYGAVVRVAPNEVSYVTGEAWDGIYKAPKGEPQLSKALPYVDPARAHQLPGLGLFGHGDDDRHQRLRKMLSPVLSDRGIREREFLIAKNVSRMIHHLKDHSSVDILGWYQAVTADIVGCFLTGTDLGLVPTGKAHLIQPANHKQLKGLAIGTAFSKNFWLRNLLVARKPLPKYTEFQALAKERFDEAMQRPDDRNDLFGALTKDMDAEKGVPQEIAFRSFADFVLAGFDTAAITLAGATHLLGRNPDKLHALQSEVRSAFDSADQITLAGVNGLKYQNAVLMETLRLWPPGPETQRRIVNKGGKMIAGQHVPAGTHVGVYHWVAGHYSGSWTNVKDFVPERWLARGEYANDQRGVMQPYNVGPRNCVGQNLANSEMRLILANLIWHFDFELIGESDNAEWMNVPIFGLVAEKKPLYVKLRYIR